MMFVQCLVVSHFLSALFFVTELLRQETTEFVGNTYCCLTQKKIQMINLEREPWIGVWTN